LFKGVDVAPNRIVGPLNLVCQQHKQKLEKKIQNFANKRNKKQKQDSKISQ
jgi:hypothetical protein